MASMCAHAGAYHSTGHVVYLGEGGTHMQQVAQLHGSENNVAELAGVLQPNTQYTWRVDALMPDGSTRQGDVWSFVTGGAVRCGREV
jgi:hypothetical protein